MAYRPVLHSNCLEVIQTLIKGAKQECNLEIEPEFEQLAAMILTMEHSDFVLTPQLASDFNALWKLPSLQAAYENRSKLQLMTSAAFMIDSCQRFASDSFVPTQDDILRARARTSGIHEIEFDMQGMHFRMVDVGGQRSERKKWAHWYDEVAL
jgi:hypothetical protein